MSLFDIKPKLENKGILTDSQWGDLKQQSAGFESTQDLGVMDDQKFQQLANTGTSLPKGTPTPKDIATMIGTHETKVKYLGGDRNDPKSYKPFVSDKEKYEYVRPNSGHLGYYQVDPETLKTYADDIFDRDVSIKEFLSSSKLQDEFIHGIIQRWRDEGMDDDEIIKRWNQGRNKNLDETTDDEDYLMKVRSGK